MSNSGEVATELQADGAALDAAPSAVHPVPALSVVVPAHDEAPNLVRLLAEVRAALDPIGLAWELIVVDDGSTDSTTEVSRRLAEMDPRVRPLRLASRSGQTAALAAGFAIARAARIATLDADLQCRPADLPALLAALDRADLACGVRISRNDPLSRRLASGLSNLTRRLVLAPRTRDLACPLRVFDVAALQRVRALTPLFDGAHRWLPALFHLAGLRVVQLPVVHRERTAGRSKYTTRGRLGPVAREASTMLHLVLRTSSAARVAVVLGLLAVSSIPFLCALGTWPLMEPDEGRNAEVAREMLSLGNWSVPHFNLVPYLDKPVLLFWLIAAAFRAVGVSEVGARLPAAVAGVATVALTAALARSPRCAALEPVPAPGPLVIGSGGSPFDMPLTALATGALPARSGAVDGWVCAAARYGLAT